MTVVSFISNSDMAKTNKGIISFCIEAAAVAVSVLILIFISDRINLFMQDESNNHTGKRWHYLEKLSRNTDVDVLVLGNSHSYTGLLPKELSCALGNVSFVLASQGNYLTDGYYMLKEAFSIVKPKLVIIETYLIRDYSQKDFTGGDLTCQIQSFEARGNFIQKLTSTPSLFSLDNIPYAWSETMRNHSFVFENKEQLEYNMDHLGERKYNDRLYLGRFVRFTTGLEKEVLDRYAKEGAPVDGKEMTVSKDAFKAMEKISELCRKEGVEVMFLTLPMYKKHISDYSAWKANVAELVDIYEYPWLDMQQDYDNALFGPESFENTYNANQHMSFVGALACTYKLADYIRKNFPSVVQSEPDMKWQKLMYGEDGYFECFTPVKNDNNNRILIQNADVGPFKVNEALFIPRAKYNEVLMKVDKSSFNGKRPAAVLPCYAEITDAKGNVQMYQIDLSRNIYFTHQDYWLYSVRMNKDYKVVRLGFPEYDMTE